MNAPKYTPQQIADWFLCSIDREAGDSITHLKLQKLVYFAQAWYLVFCGNPLFEEDFEAWSHGPVIPSLFQRYKAYGWESLPSAEECPEFDYETEHVLEEVLRVYGQHSAKHLERLTHCEDPWKTARGNLSPEEKSNAVISKQSIVEYYRNLLDQANERAEN